MSPKVLPRASALIVGRWMEDPVTEVKDLEETTHYLLEPELALTPDGNYEVSYLDGSETQDIRTVVLTGLQQIAGVTTGVIEGTDSTATIRAMEPADAVDLSPAGVPQPLDVVEAHVIRGGGMLAGEVDAAVAADNSVVTLVLDTGLGLYVRYSGDWQLLPEKSSSLEDLALYPVEPTALDIFDAADAAAQTVSIFDLPQTIEGNYYTDATEQEEEPETAVIPGPTVASIDSLLALSNAQINRASAAWYIDKRARALMPGRGGGDEQHQVITAAANFLTAVRDGGNADPQGIIRRDLIRRARGAGLLAHPTVVAAIDWRDWLHPRGRDGRFLHKSGVVNVYSSPSPGVKEQPLRGRVRELTQRGVVVDIIDPQTKAVTGEQRILNPNLLEEFRSLGDLAPATGGEGKTGTLADTFP
jgi:hypothetical protein